MTNESYDYIVVGAGATGCVVANRLSADPDVKLLLLEAGDRDTDPRIEGVGDLVRLWGSELDWKVATQEQPGMNGRKIVVNQGKVLGGSTSIHAMMYVRGNRRDFDHWQALGNSGWSYDEVLPLFKQLEDYEGGASEYRGAGGPLMIRDCPDPASRSEEFMASAIGIGYEGPYWDYNGGRQENGAGLLQFTVAKDGTRVSASSAFLKPVLERSNLVVQTRSLAARLLFDGTRTVGVEYIQDGEARQAFAEREVIVSAGAFQSPKLLMLSGLGPADHLRALGIPVVLDLPGVGQNLQDHLQLPVVFRSTVDAPMPDLLTGNVLFVRSQASKEDGPPDLQLNFTPSVPKPLSALLDFGGPALIFLPILVQPKSVGEVRLRSPNPHDPPIVDPHYLEHDTDVEVFVRAIALIRELAGTQALSELNGGELAPGADTDLNGFIRSQSSTLWHPAGTCKMGSDASAVVDAALRVRGADGLRVADASVMPVVTSGNTQAACFMIGEKVAANILGSG